MNKRYNDLIRVASYVHLKSSVFLCKHKEYIVLVVVMSHIGYETLEAKTLLNKKMLMSLVIWSFWNARSIFFLNVEMM